MRRSTLSLPFVLFTGFLALCKQGCAVKEVVVTQTTGTPPNALQIQQEIETQEGRIAQALKTGDFEPPMAQGLSENDELVKHLSLKLRVANPSHDLTTDQAGFLEILLNGNATAIGDAFQRRDVWLQAFDGNWSYNYASPGDRLLFIAVLQSLLKEQEINLTTTAQAGNLTPGQTQQGLQRLQTVRDAEISDFNQNNGLDLTSDEILELQQMADDSGRFIRFLVQGVGNGGALAQGSAPAAGGDFTGDIVSSSPSNYASYSSPAATAGNSTNYWNGRPTNLKPKTFAAVPAPTAPPAPPSPTYTPIPPPTDTPTPLPIPTAVPTPVPAPMNKAVPVSPNNSVPSANDSAAAPQQPEITYLAVDSLKARDKQIDQQFDAYRKQGKGTTAQATVATQLRKAFHQALKGDLATNQQKGVTPDQMDQLSKMLDGYASAVAGLAPPTPIPGKEK
jgi:hypothetical protein